MAAEPVAAEPVAAEPTADPVEPPLMLDPRGHEGPLFMGLSEQQRMERFYFRERDGQVVIEAEHFVTQWYGNDDYRGARWWMVNTEEFEPKEHSEFMARCELAMDELRMLDERPLNGEQTIRSIITNHTDSVGVGWEDEFDTFGCDPDPRTDGASGGAYIELLPDARYDMNESVPLSGSHWWQPEQAPRVYYRVLFTSGGDYSITIRGVNREPDSGDLHSGSASVPGADESYNRRVGPERTGRFEWFSGGTVSVKEGEYYILLAGREDGFEVDKLVVSRIACDGCSGEGPPESDVVQP